MKYDEALHSVPVLAPIGAVATAVFTAGVRVRNYRWATFLVQLGVTDTVGTITVHESTSSATTGAVAIPFSYCLTSAVGTDSRGASTTCASTGVAYADTDDGKMFIVEVDPAALDDDYDYVRVCITPSATSTSVLINAVAILKPRYPGASPISTT